MSRPSRMIDRRLAKALVFLQALTIPVATLIAWVLKDSVVAKSIALGGLVWLKISRIVQEICENNQIKRILIEN